MTTVHTAAEFVAWLGHAKSGDVVEYHRGNLAFDRHVQRDPRTGVSLMSKDKTAKALIVGELGHQALKAYEAGWVCLVQRLELDGAAYLAIRTSYPYTKLKAEQADRNRKIRAAFLAGKSQRQIAESFGIGRSSVQRALEARI